MNFSYGIIGVVGVLVAISIFFISESPNEIPEPRIVDLESPIACTMEYDPVCGVDGETYGNLCMLEASDVEFVHEGECSVDTSLIEPSVEVVIVEIPVTPRPLPVSAIEGEILEIESEFIGDDNSIVNHVFYTISAIQDGNEILYEEAHRHTTTDDNGALVELFPVHKTSVLDSSDVTVKILVTGLGHGDNVATPITTEYTMTVTPELIMVEESVEEITEELPSSLTISIPDGTGVPGCEETNECFLPFEATVSVGTTVTWSNDDTAAHTVTSGNVNAGPTGVFDSGLFMAGSTFTFDFDEAGTFDYFCMVHPWMTGIVDVI